MSTFLLTNAGPPGAWSPASFGAALRPTVVVSVSRSRGILWQDAAKTVKATADGDPVRVATCPYTSVDYTAPSDAQRPVLHTDGAGHWWLAFDGVDDYLATPSSYSSLGTDPHCIGIAGRLGGSSQCFGVTAGNVGSGDGRLLIAFGSDWYFNGLGVAGHDWDTGTAFTTADHTHVARLTGGDTVRWLVDSVELGPHTVTAFTNITNRPYYVGRRDYGIAQDLYLNGRIYGSIPAVFDASNAVRDSLKTFLRNLMP